MLDIRLIFILNHFSIVLYENMNELAKCRNYFFTQICSTDRKLRWNEIHREKEHVPFEYNKNMKAVFL